MSHGLLSPTTDSSAKVIRVTLRDGLLDPVMVISHENVASLKLVVCQTTMAYE